MWSSCCLRYAAASPPHPTGGPPTQVGCGRRPRRGASARRGGIVSSAPIEPATERDAHGDLGVSAQAVSARPPQANAADPVIPREPANPIVRPDRRRNHPRKKFDPGGPGTATYTLTSSPEARGFVGYREYRSTHDIGHRNSRRWMLLLREYASTSSLTAGSGCRWVDPLLPYCPCPVFLLKTVLLAEPVGDLIASGWRCAAVLCLMRQGNVQTG